MADPKLSSARQNSVSLEFSSSAQLGKMAHGNVSFGADLEWPQAAGEYLGMAAQAEQAALMARNVVAFGALHMVFERMVPRMLPSHLLKQLTQHQVFEVSAYLNSMVHAVICSAACLAAMLAPDGTMFEDKIHGHSSAASWVFALTTAYFVWDLTIVLRSPKVDLAFLAHHVGGISVYLTAQHPFMQFYALSCLLYELSTPLLNARSIMLTLGMKGSGLLAAVEKAFALVFVAVRLVFGIPVSAVGIYHGTMEALNGNLPHPSHFAILVAANLALNTLNILWFSKILRMATKSSSAAARPKRG